MPRRLELGDYLVEFFVNTTADPAIFHYIVTRKGSAEIQKWGSCFTEEDCRREAEKAIHQLQVQDQLFKSASNEAS